VTFPADKPAWRKWARERRAGLDIDALTTALVANLRALPAFAAARHVLLYLAMSGEVRVEEAWAPDDGKSWYAPRCAPKRRLAVHPYVPGETPLRAGPFGIREPDPTLTPEAEDPALLDLVIVPGLVFSERGGRIGYGGGYYDRFLPRTRPDCLRVVVAPSPLVVPDLPADPWDAPVDLLVTENGAFPVPAR